MQVSGWAQTAGQGGAINLAPHQYFTPQTVQPESSCYGKCLIMANFVIATGAVFIVDACSIGDIFPTLGVTHALFLSCFSTQHFITPTVYLSPVSVHNTV